MELFLSFQEQYRNVFMIRLEGDVFIYRSLGRAEYKKLMLEEDLSDLEKQDVICEVCVLWPQQYDFENCSAGLPDILYKKILENSFLDAVDSRKIVLMHYRNEMFDLDNQITCVINEAFPQFDIEEIEQWDIEKTTKYLSRAEWKLHNLRGLAFVDTSDQVESFYERVNPEEAVGPEEPAPKAPPEKEQNIRGGQKTKLTPEKIAEMKALQAKFPEIDFFGDTILTEGEAGMVDNYNELPPALRPGGR